MDNIVPKKPGVGFGVMILNDQKQLLLGKRHEDPTKADSEFKVSNCWTMPGGKLNFGESFEEGATREAIEETGIKIFSPKVIAVNQDMNQHAHFITVGLFCDKFEGEAKVMEPEEITEWKWFNLNDLPENIYFPSVKVLENYKRGKFYIKPLENIEVELRSFISKEKYFDLIEFFKKNSKFIKEDEQETHYLDCKEDVRIQKNNFFSKIWMKKGKIHEEAREEMEIKLPKEDFQKLEKVFLSIGINTKIKWFRKRLEFDWNGISVSLDYTKGYGYIIELEKITSENHKQKIVEELKTKFAELNIPISPKEEFDNAFKNYEQNWRELIK